ncbi:hypothetical protein [Hymenobacter sp. BT730]|uniref:hypothetical protein n=1 Tax=Hymenobacter sp. BT730 TaxID=3063332 RepID=UPI0026DEAAD2|nr:hypothetical protein [Hymenobacter sp. BT730]
MIAHASTRAQSEQRAPSRTVTGLGDPEPAMPRILSSPIAGISLESLFEGNQSETPDSLPQDRIPATKKQESPGHTSEENQSGKPR